MPCIVAKGLAEGMAADMTVQPAVLGGLPDNTECLGTAEGIMGRFLACENKIVFIIGMKGCPVKF